MIGQTCAPFSDTMHIDWHKDGKDLISVNRDNTIRLLDFKEVLSKYKYEH